MKNAMSVYNELPNWMKRLIPVFSLIISSLAIGYVVRLFLQDSIEPIHWVRIVILGIMGMIVLAAAVIFFFNHALSWQWLVGGLTLIPILLMFQLIFLLATVAVRVVKMIFSGNVPEPIQKFIDNYPSKVDVIILVIIGILAISAIVKKIKENQN